MFASDDKWPLTTAPTNIGLLAHKTGFPLNPAKRLWNMEIDCGMWILETKSWWSIGDNGQRIFTLTINSRDIGYWMNHWIRPPLAHRCASLIGYRSWLVTYGLAWSRSPLEGFIDECLDLGMKIKNISVFAYGWTRKKSAKQSLS